MANFLHIVLMVGVIYLINQGEAMAQGQKSSKSLSGSESIIPFNKVEPCQSCNCTPDTWVSDPLRNPDDCYSYKKSKYCYCIYGQTRWMTCPPHLEGRLKFDPVKKECVDPIEYDCDSYDDPNVCDRNYYKTISK